jgi:pSer/pThr/pTyr-binding forkhead associated (FHA) protein
LPFHDDILQWIFLLAAGGEMEEMESGEHDSIIEINFLLGAQAGKIMVIEKPGIFSIGRDPSCYLTIDETDVSRFHGRLRWDGAIMTIEDLRSKNGIFLNGKRIVCYKVESGDTIDMGSCTFQIIKKEKSLYSNYYLQNVGYAENQLH